MESVCTAENMQSQFKDSTIEYIRYDGSPTIDECSAESMNHYKVFIGNEYIDVNTDEQIIKLENEDISSDMYDSNVICVSDNLIVIEPDLVFSRIIAEAENTTEKHEFDNAFLDDSKILESDIKYSISDTGEVIVTYDSLPHNETTSQDCANMYNGISWQELHAQDKLECKILYLCKICSTEFEDKTEYRLHICYDMSKIMVYNKKKIKIFRCLICSTDFRSKLVFSFHMDQHPIVQNYCSYCKKMLKNETAIESHLRFQHNTSVLSYTKRNDLDNMYSFAEDMNDQCHICGKITNQLEKHKLFHAVEELEYNKSLKGGSKKLWFPCKICSKKIYSEISFLFHQAKHAGESCVRCNKCNFSSSSYVEFNMHYSSKHTGEKSFICNDCDKCFYTRSAISDHVLTHMNELRYMCEICGKQFKTCRAHAQHKLLQHKKYFRCPKCNRGFSSKEKQKVHNSVCLVISNADVTPVSNGTTYDGVSYCPICNVNIKTNSEITMMFHRAKHEGKQGIPCSFCKVLCKSVYTYKNHMLIHTQERPFSCMKCKKTFRTKGCLVQHMLIHGDEYRYTCKFCGKKSKKLTTHINHVNIHTDTRPYRCPDCERPFRQLSDMKKHRKTHVKRKSPEQEQIRFTLLSINTPIKDELLLPAENVVYSEAI